MAKRANLAAALHEAGAKPSVSAVTTLPAAMEMAPIKSEVVVRPASREGQRAVTVYVNPDAHKQLRLLSVEAGVSVQDLMTEAMNGLFQKRGRAQIA